MFLGTRPHDGFLTQQVAIPDEEIVRALVEEVVHVMSGPLFHAALKVCRHSYETLKCSASFRTAPIRRHTN